MDKKVVDSWEQCAHRGEVKRFAETGEFDSTTIFGEVGETAVGSKPGRESLDERILVIPVGLGSHDIAIAKALQDAVLADEHRHTFTFFR
jgi:ornithine cyclodeaminase